jgi:tRNA-2-methylthio-N6-dimethylallyladenosine synthase
MTKPVEMSIDESKQGEAMMLSSNPVSPFTKKLYLESYGCQMNFSDSEIVASIMSGIGYQTTQDIDAADVILMNSCAIRDNAEQKVWNRLKQLRQNKKRNPELIIGLLGCMAERLKTKVLEEEKLVDLVVGPDAYRELPNLISTVETGQKAINVLLSREETYAEISPVRLSGDGVSAFISIMRGCDNMCSFCVVPFTRGRERSRDPRTIVKEAEELISNGYREVTLLGQNVDSYKYLMENDEVVNFAGLLEQVANTSPELRVRFSTSHPKDITDDVLHTISKYHNICNYIHLPVQSGSSRVLELMNRTYTREWYMERVNKIKEILPDCGLSTDIIAGFCSETDEEHLETLSLMEWADFSYAYMFKYSERPGTLAARKYADDVSEEKKSARLQEIIELQKKLSLKSNLKDINLVHTVLVEGLSKRSDQFMCGRNDQNKMVVFPKGHFKKGDYVKVLVTECTPGTLIGIAS